MSLITASVLARVRRKGALAASPEALNLPVIPVWRPGKREGIAVLAIFVGIAALFLGSSLVPQKPLGDETVSVQDDPQPAEPKPEQPVPPQLPEPPMPEVSEEAAPDQTPDPQPSPDPPPPQFGLPDGSTADNGNFAVATGSTVMKPAEAVVKPAAPVAAPAASQGSTTGPALLTREPDILTPGTPEYPAWAEEQGVNAVVIAWVYIDAQGTVTDVRITRSGGKDFDRSVRSFLAAARYRPYLKNGQAIPAVFQRTFHFQLD